MMMIMIAGFVDSIRTPIQAWLDKVLYSDDHQKTTTNMMVKEVRIDSPRVDCIVCLSDVTLVEKYATLERCKHGFHVECVEAWLKDHPNCPLCRTPISGDDQDTHKHTVYIKKLYETLASWLTKSFSQDLQSTESCNYL